LQASHREAASAHDPVMPRHAAPNQQGGGIGKQRMLRAMDAIRRGINDTIDTIVEIPAKTSAGVFAKLRLTQFYEPEGVSSLYGCAEIFADIDRLSPETKIGGGVEA
jgi:hypothetical protein